MALTMLGVVGPTACGKTRRAVELAHAFDGEIVSGDSRQVYRGMDIGTGKDLGEYAGVPYHLIDVAEAGEVYNLYRFLSDFDKAEADLNRRGKRLVLCGGTGMYVEAAIKGLHMPEVPRNERLRAELSEVDDATLRRMLAESKQLHNVTDLDTRQRMERAYEIQHYYRLHPEEAGRCDLNNANPRDCVTIGLDIPREERRSKITSRLKARLDEGMVDEVKGLLEKGVKPEALINYGLEYKYLTLFLTGGLTYAEMTSQLEIAIHQFAKRQMTWWRGMERRGLKINWLPYDMPTDELVDATARLLLTHNKRI